MVKLLKLLSVLHGRDLYSGSNAFIPNETPKAHDFWTVYSALMAKITENLNLIEVAIESNSMKSILK